MRFLIIVCFAILSFSYEINLTKNEKEFINTHTIKCITTAKWAPFNTKIDGKLQGIAVDYWKLVSKRLHLKEKCIIQNEWSQVLESIKEKKADVTIATTQNPVKLKYAVFSIPYAKFPYVIATKNNVGYIGSMNFLKDKKIAVGKKYAIAYLLKKHYPNYKIIEVKDVKKALELVSEGKAYAAIDILPVVVYHINKYQFANLKISGKTPWDFNMQFMIRNDYKPLQSAINKAIKSISKEEKHSIYHKWVNVTFINGYTLKQILSIIAVTSVIIILLLIWIRKLKKEIHRRIILEKQLQKLSVLDTLTGIFNRYKIELALKQHISFAQRNQTPLSVIFFDVDHFKRINDTYGHAVGDEVLRNITQLVKDSLREYDIFGRWGGEEFVVILPNTNLQNAVAVAKKLKQTLEKHTHRKVGKVTCSFGVTEFKDDDDTDTLLIRADKLMYEAKQKGRNTIIFG